MSKLHVDKLWTVDCVDCRKDHVQQQVKRVESHQNHGVNMSEDEDTFISLGEAVARVIERLCEQYEARNGADQINSSGDMDGRGIHVPDSTRTSSLHRDLE